MNLSEKFRNARVAYCRGNGRMYPMVYEVIANPDNLTPDELSMVADHGAMGFGCHTYMKDGKEYLSYYID